MGHTVTLNPVFFLYGTTSTIVATKLCTLIIYPLSKFILVINPEFSCTILCRDLYLGNMGLIPRLVEKEIDDMLKDDKHKLKYIMCDIFNAILTQNLKYGNIDVNFSMVPETIIIHLKIKY